MLHELLEFIKNPEVQQRFIRDGGYVLLSAIIFSETGLLVGFFLPGDSLLFSAGVVAAIPASGMNVWVMCVLLSVMAIVGDAVGYAFGRWTGPKLYDRKESFFFRKKHLLATKAFYEKHGGKTIILARFMPFARTFAPIVAGVAQMPYSRFAPFNIVGGVAWVWSMTLLGYFLGSKLSGKNVEKAVYLIILVSLMPLVIGWLKNRKAEANAATNPSPDTPSSKDASAS